MTTGESSASALDLRVGFCSERGSRPANEDYAGYYLGTPSILAVADGVGGAKGGRVAAELAVSSFIEGCLGLNPLNGIRRNAAASLDSINRWIHEIGRRDQGLEGMATTLSALILQGSAAHVVHVGDSRLYRLRDGVLVQLTDDHVPSQPGLRHTLLRAVGLEPSVRIDYAVEPLRVHDRFLLATDGVHGALSAARLTGELARGNAPDEAARRIVAAALAADIGDNATALVADILDLPPPDLDGMANAASALPMIEPPASGQMIDGLLLGPVLSDGRLSRLFRATDTATGQSVVVKFPKPVIADDPVLRRAFLREAWAGLLVRSPYLGQIIERPADRCTCLYIVMPHYEGLTLGQRLQRRPPIGLANGLVIAGKLGKAVATLHRAGIIHRDIKPENIILAPGSGLRLLDLGVARLVRLDDVGETAVPGTASYMAPELFAGERADERSDLFAIGVTIYRMFTGEYPYGEIEPFSHPRFRQSQPLGTYRPDLPAWLDQILGRLYAVERERRFSDVLEFVFELERAASSAGPPPPRWQPLYERNPLLVWKLIAGFLAILLVWSLAARR
jgi:serine/threonine protein phosphatase PrpC